jgi:hypothetical protein
MAYLRGLATLVISTMLMVAAQSPLAAQSAGLDGAVYRGTCDRLIEQANDLTPAVFGTGERRGNSQAVPATSFFATIPVSLDTLLADDHALVASNPEGGPVACGEIGGALTEDGALFIGLSAEEESGITGIAYLAPSEEASQTDVSLLIAGEPLSEVSNARTEEEAAYAQDLIDITLSMLDSFSEFKVLAANPRVEEEDWTRDVEAQVTIWDSNYEKSLALDPPPVFAETHALLVDALRHYSKAGDDFLVAFDTDDADVMNRALSAAAEADRLLSQVTPEVQRILDERGE